MVCFSVNVFLNSVCWYVGLIMCPHMSKADCENYSTGLSIVKCMGVSVCWAGRKPETKVRMVPSEQPS